MGKHDNLPPIPSDEELAELAEFAAEHPDERSTESEVADGEKIQVPLAGFGSPTASYGGLNSGDIALGVDTIEDSSLVDERRRERERLDDDENTR
jgi:hypothetical protein